MGRLVLHLTPDDYLVLQDGTEIRVTKGRGNRIRVLVDGPATILRAKAIERLRLEQNKGNHVEK